MQMQGRAQYRSSFHAWGNLLEHFQPFRADAVFKRRKAGDVTAWLRQARDEAGANGVRDCRKHDRYPGSRPLRRPQGYAAGDKNHIGASATNSSTRLRIISGSPSPERTSNRALRSELQPSWSIACKNVQVCFSGGCRGAGRKHADELDARALLRIRGEGPNCGRTTDETHKLGDAENSTVRDPLSMRDVILS
jgi:hypothetical protein